MISNRSWYQDSVPAQPPRPAAGDMDVDVAIVGGGYTGLGAALELAAHGKNVAVLEAGRIGDGASGRNGGQVHTGQRLDPHVLSQMLGADAARQLWDMAADAQINLMVLRRGRRIECDWHGGLYHAWHRPRFEAEDRAYARSVAGWVDADRFQFLDRAEIARHLGTGVYCGGMLDTGGGHVHPLKLLLGMARAAEADGAKLYENSRVARFEQRLDGARLTLGNGSTIVCRKLLLCGNGLMDGLDERIDAHVIPIHNFMVATAPLEDPSILPLDFAASDTRFVVNYFRKTADNRLIFGGGEGYGTGFPRDIAAIVRRNMLKVYPQLKDVEITHAWGGTLAITLTRAPFVRQLSADVLVSAGYSGQGVVLAPWFGKLMARAVMGDARDIALLSRLPVPPFPGGRWLRKPLLAAGLSYYALRDRL
jgi:gamma-glutamylputrescine oxidase